MERSGRHSWCGAADSNRHCGLLPALRYGQPQLLEEVGRRLHRWQSLDKGYFVLPQHDAPAGAPLPSTDTGHSAQANSRANRCYRFQSLFRMLFFLLRLLFSAQPVIQSTALARNCEKQEWIQICYQSTSILNRNPTESHQFECSSFEMLLLLFGSRSASLSCPVQRD
jgi:hypothetical protein